MTDPDFAARQTPRADEIYLDHVGWYVPDIDVASTSFERMGFRLTPFTWHENETTAGTREPSGTGNRCAMLELGYLEFLTAAPDLDLPLARQLRAGAARYTGIHLIAFTCADADSEWTRLSAHGFAPQPVVHLRRPIQTDRGDEALLGFSVIRTQPGSMPEGRIQMLTQETPDITWQPSLIARDNSVDALSGVVVCTDDPIEAADRFARFTGQSSVRQTVGHAVPLHRGRVSFVSPDGFAALIPGGQIAGRPFIGAVTLRSKDVAHTRQFLHERGVGLSFDRDEAVCVDIADGAGAYIVIHQQHDMWPR